MAVYVDKAKHRFGRMIMCHMVADGIAELLCMADAIGPARRHFQPWSHPHFDVSLEYRSKALRLGAIEIDRRTLVERMRVYRGRLEASPEERARLASATEASDKGRRTRQGQGSAGGRPASYNAL